jgi:hypothetical protein
MNNDRELLELAARAGGVVFCDGEDIYGGLILVGGHSWNPLTDDGDALRLAVKLGLDIESDLPAHLVEVWFPNGINTCGSVYEPYGNDPYAATRRAIVRAAAEIGKEMK